MPIYEYRCASCNHLFTKILKIVDRKDPELEPCPACDQMKIDQVITVAPGIGDPIRLGVTKRDAGFKEVLQGIHAKTAGSKIDTYL